MAAYIAFLRGINVGGKNMVPMAGLRTMCEELGLEDVKTLLQSGNVVFRAGRKTPEALEAMLEKETAKRFGVTIDFMVRSDADLAKVFAENPFLKEAKEDPGHLLVLFLKSNPAKDAEKALRETIKGSEVVLVRGKEAYATYPDGIGTSKLTNAVLEKKLGTRATGRNWNTISKLLEIAKAMA